jgi:hypothetical protein
MLRLAVALSLLPALLPASDFAGKWKPDEKQTKQLGPATTVIITKAPQGYRIRWSTGAEQEIIFDGKEHALPPRFRFDTAIYRRVNSSTFEETGRRGGTNAGTATWSVSANGEELHQRTEGTFRNGTPYRNESSMKRIAGPKTDDRFVGAWEVDPTRGRTGIPLYLTIADTDKGLRVDRSAGLSYTARFDGAPAVVTGSSQQGLTASLERLGPTTIRETLRRKDGTVYRTATLEIVNGRLTEHWEMAEPNAQPMKGSAVYDRQ